LEPSGESAQGSELARTTGKHGDICVGRTIMSNVPDATIRRSDMVRHIIRRKIAGKTATRPDLVPGHKSFTLIGF
jgi:hypothetical protein